MKYVYLAYKWLLGWAKKVCTCTYLLGVRYYRDSQGKHLSACDGSNAALPRHKVEYNRVSMEL